MLCLDNLRPCAIGPASVLTGALIFILMIKISPVIFSCQVGQSAMEVTSLVVGLASAASLISLGGGLYEVSVVDPAWPKRPDIVQPKKGGISRRRFWIPAHATFELPLIAALILAWTAPDIRVWLLAALGTHAVMRVWSAIDFIPKALAFERADQVAEVDGYHWVRRSRWRLPLDFMTSAFMAAALAMACLDSART